MNEEYFQFALRVLEDITDEEFEAKLVEHGFNPRKKIKCTGCNGYGILHAFDSDVYSLSKAFFKNNYHHVCANEHLVDLSIEE